MTRGDTTTFRITLPVSAGTDDRTTVSGFLVDTLDKYCLAFGIGRKVLVEKTGEFSEEQIEAIKTSHIFEVKLTEDESLRMRAGSITAQLKIYFKTGDVVTSSQVEFDVDETLCTKNSGGHNA